MNHHCVIALNGHSHYLASYCIADDYDWDLGLGPTLLKYFNTRHCVEALVKLGDIYKLEGQDVKALHRDNGLPWEDTQPEQCDGLDSLLSYAKNSGAEFLYVFEKDGWHTVRFDVSSKKRRTKWNMDNVIAFA